MGETRKEQGGGKRPKIVLGHKMTTSKAEMLGKAVAIKVWSSGRGQIQRLLCF